MKNTDISTYLIFIFISFEYVNGKADSPPDVQLWKYDTVTKDLFNKNGSWLHQSKKWIIPNLKEGGYIEDNSTGQVLTLKDSKIENGTQVVLETKKEPISDPQKWFRKTWDAIEDGYFVFINSDNFALSKDGVEKILITDFKDENPIMKQLGNIIQGAVGGAIALISFTAWIYCLCCRKKARMTMEERDQEQKQKWEQNNGHQRF